MRRNLLRAFAIVLAVMLALGWWWQPAREAPPPAGPPALSGTVVDDLGQPLSGARVRWQGAPLFVVTDADGRFTLATIDGDARRVTAAKPGYLIAGARPTGETLRLTLAALRDPDNPDYEWVDPTPDPQREQHCGNCHAEIYDEWRKSGHARSANGTQLLELYARAHATAASPFDWSLADDYPEGLGVCASCHAPSVDPLDKGQHDLRHLEGVAAHGVHCDFCHKIEDAFDDRIGLSHGTFGLKLRRPAHGQLFFGPLDDVDRGEDAFAPVHQESRVCASCHEGTVFGVAVYTTYSEWLASPARQAGQQCQSCHMAPTETMRNIAPGSGGIERQPNTLASHRLLPGGVGAMLKKSLQVETKVTPPSEQADFNVSVSLDVTVTATNVGHRVPTGYIDRHLLLLVQATDAADQPVAALAGPILPAAAGTDWQRQPGWLYGRLLRDPEGRSPAPFWSAGVSIQDTRLAPEQPHTTTFIFPIVATHVRVRLVYRRFWQQVTEAKQWDDDTLTIVDRTIDLRPR